MSKTLDIKSTEVVLNGNLTSATGNVVIRSDLNVFGNITSQNFLSNAIRINNLETRIFANTLVHSSNANAFQTGSFLNIDANLYSFYTHFGVYPAGTINAQVSNLTNGKQVFAFFRNIGPTNTPTITVTTSPNTTGYVAPFMSRPSSGTIAAVNVSLALPINGGCVLFMVANVSSNVCGTFL